MVSAVRCFHTFSHAQKVEQRRRMNTLSNSDICKSISLSSHSRGNYCFGEVSCDVSGYSCNAWQTCFDNRSHLLLASPICSHGLSDKTGFRITHALSNLSLLNTWISCTYRIDFVNLLKRIPSAVSTKTCRTYVIIAPEYLGKSPCFLRCLV